MAEQTDSMQRYCRAALAKLGVEKLVLAIHDQSFPSLPEEELGRGTPYSKGGRKFAKFISELGFTAIQLGPQGKTSLSNPSPYDSTIFSKSDLSISLLSLAEDEPWQGLLSREEVNALVNKTTTSRDKTSYTYSWHAQQKALRMAFGRFAEQRDRYQQLWSEFSSWCEEQSHWLHRDAIFETLSLEHNSDDWRQWGEQDRELSANAGAPSEAASKRIEELQRKYRDEIDFYKFSQFVAHRQHQAFRQLTKSLGLELFADVQIGFSQRDLWGMRYLFLPNYLLGAPPSRTNPDGQPWGYPLLNPDLYHERTVQASDRAEKDSQAPDRAKKDAPAASLAKKNGDVELSATKEVLTEGPAMRWLKRRIDKLLLDFDGLRIDHPHGIICPWIYKSTEENALHAVQNGARLFDSPDVADHPALAAYAIVEPDQLNEDLPRYADGWVKELSDEQVDRYGVLVKAIIDRVLATGLQQTNVICEVLSSCPYPLKRVMEKYGLGRFRVTQKAKPDDRADVYRSDSAQPADWIMVGTHDTKPIWMVVDEWTDELRAAWAKYLAARLEPNPTERAEFEKKLLSDRSHLVDAMFADLFVGPARNVQIFFADVFGIREVYNQPGVTSDANWTLSVPNDYQRIYAELLHHGQALNLARVLSMALKARFDDTESHKLRENLGCSASVPTAPASSQH